MEELGERDHRLQKAAALRAGLIAAAIYNVNRKKGARALKASDFVRSERRHLSPEEAARFMDRWAADMNKRHEA